MLDGLARSSKTCSAVYFNLRFLYLRQLVAAYDKAPPIFLQDQCAMMRSDSSDWPIALSDFAGKGEKPRGTRRIVGKLCNYFIPVKDSRKTQAPDRKALC